VKSITEILVKVYNEIKNKGLYNNNFVLGAMNLLYKKKNKQQIENYRSIMLTNTDYKVYTKTIVGKLRKIIYKIIHPNQLHPQQKYIQPYETNKIHDSLL